MSMVADSRSSRITLMTLSCPHGRRTVQRSHTLTYAELVSIEHDMDELARLRDDNTVDLKTETIAYLQEIVRVTLEKSGLQFEE